MIAGHPVDGARRLAIDEDDALVALAHLGKIALGDEGLAEGLGEEFEQSGEILVALAQPEHAGAAIAVERLQDDVAMGAAEGGDLHRIAGDQRRRHEVADSAGRRVSPAHCAPRPDR